MTTTIRDEITTARDKLTAAIRMCDHALDGGLPPTDGATAAATLADAAIAHLAKAALSTEGTSGRGA